MGPGWFLLVLAFFVPSWHSSYGDTAAPLDQQQIIQFLNKTISWNQHMAVELPTKTNPGDVIFLNDERSLASQVVELSFDFAHAAAQLPGVGSGLTTNPAASSDPHYKALAQAAARLDQQLKQNNSDLQSLKEKLDKGSAKQRKAVASQIAETESEAALLQARRDAVHNVLQFTGGAAEPGGLASEIDALERSVPDVQTHGKTQGNSPPAGGGPDTAASVPHPESLGIWGSLREIFNLSHKVSMIDDARRRTDSLIEITEEMQSPLREQMKQMTIRGDSIVNQPDSQDPAVLAQQKAALDALTAQFKLLSASLLPLHKDLILLGAYRGNLLSWRAAINSEYSGNIKNLAIRLLGLLLIIGVVLGVFEIWRRAVYRYVPDARRRYPLLVLRRIALWCVIAMIVVIFFMNQLGSIATFAGLMTAGVAVALQNVILAVVGYFMLIGKFGVKVGDRVQVSDITGEVVEIGMIRLHVMELTGTGRESQPTGRVVAFSNSIVFQPTVGLFRQAPGASFAWHEISITLAADSNYQDVERRIFAAVDGAFKDYRQAFEQLRHRMETSLRSVSIGSLEPKVRLRLSPAGLEVQVRFPVELQKTNEIDARMTRELLHAIEQEPRLKVVGAEVPTVRLKTEASAVDVDEQPVKQI
jgi:small-conductance mechanosensitive channel